MATPAPAGGEDYEYDSCNVIKSARSFTHCYGSYEALPPNFTLTNNMIAGAFAGIAVRSPLL